MTAGELVTTAPAVTAGRAVTTGTATTRSDLVAAATVGTAHRPINLAALPERLRPDPLPADPGEGLLDAAALSALAGRTIPRSAPAATGPPAGPAPENMPVVPIVITQVLSRVAHQPAILLEALGLIGDAGLRLPPELVPGLLDDTRPDVVAAARPVTGEIGRFLMTKNPRWAAPTAADPADRTMWDEGTTAERLTWLRAFRDVDPDSARDILAENFSRESAANRAALLGALEVGLSGADEEFLMAAVGDRSRGVVAAALSLLARLPGSALRRDMRTLAARRLRVVRRLLLSTVTVGDLGPQDFAPWPIPDGGPWNELMSRIDPAEWPQLFGGDLLKIVASGSPDLPPLWHGIRLAAITFRHHALARVLVSVMFTLAGLKAPPTVDGELWALLNPIDATAQLDQLLRHPLVRPEQVTTATAAFAPPWPTPLARRFGRWLPTGGHAGAPAPRPLWDRWAIAAALPDCRMLIDLIRSAPTNHPPTATGDHSSALTTRVSNAANLLTLRAVLYENLCFPGGNSD